MDFQRVLVSFDVLERFPNLVRQMSLGDVENCDSEESHVGHFFFRGKKSDSSGL